jgi:hypothetical protein
LSYRVCSSPDSIEIPCGDRDSNLADWNWLLPHDFMFYPYLGADGVLSLSPSSITLLQR